MDNFPETPQFPPYISNSDIKLWDLCQRRWFYSRVMNAGKADSKINANLHAGSAFHRGLEIARSAFYIKGADKESAELAGLFALLESFGDFEPESDRSPKTFDRVSDAFLSYMEHYNLPDKEMTPYYRSEEGSFEVKFSVPLPINNPQTGDPITFNGTIDMLATHTSGLILVVDDKTAQYLTPTWRLGWDLSAQLMGYVWAAQQHGIEARAAAIRATAITKTKVEHDTIIVTFPSWQLEEWYGKLLNRVKDMVRTFKRFLQEGGVRMWVPNLGSACSGYDSCFYSLLCKIENPLSGPLQTYYDYVQDDRYAQ